MSKIMPIDPALAPGGTRQLLDWFDDRLGMVPNMVSVMANSPAVLRGYMGLSGALSGGSLGPALRERIALAVAEANGCDYCLAAHATLGAAAGIDEAEIEASRRGTANEPRAAAALRFAVALVEGRGHVTDAELSRVRSAGYTDAAILEIVAEVVLNVFTNYINILAATEIDFPRVAPLAKAA